MNGLSRWRTIQCILFPLTTLLMGACKSETAARDPSPAHWYFIQLADPQCVFFTVNQDFARVTVNFERSIAAANQLKPAFVVFCGDLSHRVDYSAHIAEYKRVAAQLDHSIPLYNVPGNHDVGQV